MGVKWARASLIYIPVESIFLDDMRVYCARQLLQNIYFGIHACLIMDHHHPHLPDVVIGHLESEHEFLQANKQHFDGIACRYDQHKNTEILARK